MGTWYDPLGITDKASEIVGLPTADEKRHKQKEVNDQIKAYKEQTELTRKEIEAKRGEAAAEKRRVDQKQIRQLRRNYGTGTLLGSSTPASPDMNNKLGG